LHLFDLKWIKFFVHSSSLRDFLGKANSHSLRKNFSRELPVIFRKKTVDSFYSTLYIFCDEIRERSFLQRNKFRRKGVNHPFREIYLAAENFSPKIIAKNYKIELKNPPKVVKLDFAIFWTEIRERSFLQRNKFRRKGFFTPSEKFI